MESRKGISNQSYMRTNTNNTDEDYNYPTEEELNRINRLRNNNNNQEIIDNNSINEEDYFCGDDTDEHINIQQPNNYNSLLNLNNFHIHNPNNINSINYINNENNNRNNNINNINNINNKTESFLDKDGNIIYRNKNSEPEIKMLDSHRIMVGNNEFEDLTKEAREMQNKEAYEKKILNIYQNENREIKEEKKPFMERVAQFLDDHGDGIMAVIDGIGCILLHGPSIARTIHRVDRWIDGIGSNDDPRQDNERNNIINEVGLQNKERDVYTILKFLPVWEVRENKKSENNNNCVVCLYEFQIGDEISALPCCHVFHTKCIDSWLKNELTCPVCKFEVTLSSIIGNN